MAIDRRHLLIGTLAFVGSGGLRNAFGADAANEVTYASAARRSDGSFCIVLLSADGRLVREIPLSARGHDIALHRPAGRAVAFARRPGTFAVAFRFDRDEPPVIFNAATGRHFYGHGAFSADGRLLYVSENDIAGARGVVGIYDVAAGYKKIGEHASYGVGPHELILLPDGKTLAIANGGLDTVPDAGRENLNLDDMKPSLAFVDAMSGARLADFPLGGDLRSLSIRHLAADARGNVWFGGQWQGVLAEAPALIGSASIGGALRLLPGDGVNTPDLKGYVGSMAASGDGRIIAASSPKAGRVVFIDAAASEIVAESDLKDACGIAPEGTADFATTSGLGKLRHETKTARIISETEVADIAFDNHLRRLS